MPKNISDEEKEVCLKIKKIREKAGLKQYQFADKLGISPGTLSDIESCKSAPKLKTLISVCRTILMLGYDIQYLFTENISVESIQQPAGNSVPARAAPMGTQLTKEQKELLSYFDKMDDIAKGRLLEKAETFAIERKKKVGRITPKDTEISKEFVLLPYASDEALAIPKEEILKNTRRPEEILH